MNKNTKLRKQLKDLIEAEKHEVPKRKQFKGTLLRLSSSEVTLKVKDLRQILTLDIKKSSEKQQVNRLTRDISHLQDKKTPTSISLPILPTDIEVLKKMRSTENQNFHTPSRCKRENCLDSAFLTIKKFNDGETSDNIDKILMGNPTGRQDIKELCTWFSSMLEVHQESDIDTLMLIYEACSKEIIRQVAVQCIERGELLQILFNYMPEVYKRKIEELNKDIERIKMKQLKEVEGLKERVRRGMKEIAEKNFLLKKVLEVGQKEKEKMMTEFNKLKFRYNEFVRKYNDEEKIWKNKHINLLVKLRDSFSNKQNLTVSNSRSLLESPEKALQFDANSIINQEIMEYEAHLVKAETQAEVIIETAEEIDTDKLLEEFESKFEENVKKHEESEIHLELNLENPPFDEKFQELPETQETFIQVAEKETLTCPSSEFFMIQVVFTENIIQSKPVLSLQSIKGDSIDISPDDFFKSEKKSEYSEYEPKKLEIPTKSKKPKKKTKILKKTESKPSKKEAELQILVDNLKQQLLEKKEALSELTFNSKMNSFNFQTENFRLNLGKALLKNSSNVTPNLSTPRETQFLSPTAFLSQEISPRDSVLQLSEIGRDLDDNSQNIEINLIPPGCDVYSWKAGFSTGFEKGKKEGFKEGELLGVEEKEFEVHSETKSEIAEEPENKTFTHSTSIRTELFRKKVREVTRIMQFSFTRPGTHKKQHPVYSLMSKFMVKSKESIISLCSLSRKIVNKMIHTTYMNCLNKLRNGDLIENLVEQVYDDFYQKYGLKAVCEKRFVEFVSSLFAYTSFRRVSVFLKFLGCGGKAQLKSYSKFSFMFYLSALSAMINSKVGVMIAFDEIADKQMFPALRGVECVKEKLEWIVGSHRVSFINNEVQKHVESDLKGVNPTGLIELELVLELIVDAYEEYQQMVEAGLIVICNAFAFDRPVGNFEFFVILRWVSPESLEFSDDEGKTENNKKLYVGSLMKEFENKENYALHEISSKCISFNLLKIDDVQRFCPKCEDVDKDAFLQDIRNSRQILENVANFIGENGKKFKTLNGSGFIEWMNEVENHFTIKEVYYSMVAWKILESELKRIKTEMNL